MTPLLALKLFTSSQEARNVSPGTAKAHSTIPSNHLLQDDGQHGEISESHEHRPIAMLLLLTFFLLLV